jgi:FemAB-related protein (PEP-CTERM system-associated)
MVKLLSSGQEMRQTWTDYVSGFPQTTFTDLWEWGELVEQVYGLSQYRYLALDSITGNPVGLLALTKTRHPILGHYLATAPFANWGGFYAQTAEAKRILLQQAKALNQQLSTDYVVLRLPVDDSPPPEGWRLDTSRAWYSLPLPHTADALLSGFGQNLRSKVRRSLKKGFVARWGGREMIEEFHATMIRCMRELGSPYHDHVYLGRMLALLGGAVRLVLVDAPGAPGIGAGLTLDVHDGTVLYHGNILHKYRSDYAGNFLYYAITTDAIVRGRKWLDMGRSLADSGNESFKMEWGPQRKMLAEWYALPAGHSLPGLNQNNPRFRLARWIWKRLPISAARSLGPGFIRGLL